MTTTKDCAIQCCLLDAPPLNKSLVQQCDSESDVDSTTEAETDCDDLEDYNDSDDNDLGRLVLCCLTMLYILTSNDH